MSDAQHIIDKERRFGAFNYAPLPVVLTHGEGCHVWDTEGHRYLDMMSAYSAVSHGHAHPRLVSVLHEQAGQLAVVSRAFYSDQLAPFLEKLCLMSGMDMALPMNTGAEAVETGIKAARKWAYEVKGVSDDCAEIIACEGNFHGRTLGAVAMSSEPQYRKNFGPFPSGFKVIAYDDPAALEAAITKNTAAFIVEPVQGEGGIRIPQPDYLAACADICRRHNVLLLCDEIQTGLGRTGAFLASQHAQVQPDGLMLGKALGGGLYPVSAFLARRDILERFKPGDHGSTFGGNPLAAKLAYEALQVIEDEGLILNSAIMGKRLLEGLKKIDSPLVDDIRGQGLLIGIEINSQLASARLICEALMKNGILTKETHETVVRMAPPLTINDLQIDGALECVEKTLREFRQP